MRSSARALQPITRAAAAIGILAACSEAKRADDRAKPATAPSAAPAAASTHDAPPDAPPPDAPPPDAPPPDAPRGTITLTVKPAKMHEGIAKRCAIVGDPIGGTCRSGKGGLAIDAKGVVYIVEDERVLRYRRAADADGCRYEVAGAPIALPAPPVRKQRADGPVFLRSGGSQWRLSRVGDAIYAADFLAGLYRVDRGRAAPACVDVFGYDQVARVGGKLLVARDGIERLAIGATCTARDAGIDAKLSGDLYGIGDQLYAVARGRGEVVRYDGTTRVPVAQDVRVCSVRGLAPCGDGACILDQNCMQLVQVGPDGAGRVLDGDDLFERRPWTLAAAAPLQGGGLLVLARHLDATAASEVCEAALYELPPALFAR